MKLKNPKAKGSRNERRMRDWLEARGYSVTKAGGSLGCWDLIGHRKNLNGVRAMKRHESPPFDDVLVLVQVKSSAPPGPAERLRMQDYIATHQSTDASYLIAYWKPQARQPCLRSWLVDHWEVLQ